MRPLSASDLLNIWECGAGRMPVEQALLILEAAFPHASGDALVQLNIAQRDAALFHLQEITFSPHLKGLADCPVCRERLELAFDARDVYTPGAALPDPEAMETLNAEASFRMGICEVSYRLPTSADLLAIAKLTDPAQARQKLLEACLVSVSRRGKAASASDLPSKVFDALIERMGESDPLINLTLAATCPACGHKWEIVFDIVSYFWSEINAWAVRMLREIHILASTYGWREADILAMSAWRRQHYLELIGTS